MSKEFENLLELLKSGISVNVRLGLLLAQNFRKEFKHFFNCELVMCCK